MDTDPLENTSSFCGKSQMGCLCSAAAGEECLLSEAKSSGVMICVLSGELAAAPTIAAESLARVLIRFAQGRQSGTFSQIALTPAMSGMAKNKPGRPHSRSQNKHAKMTVVAFSSMLRPIKTGTIRNSVSAVARKNP